MPRLNWIVPCTISKLFKLGRICSIAMRPVDFPQTRAARMNSRCQRLSAPPRVTRAKTGILKIPIAMIAFTALAPKSAVINIAITKEGKAKIKSLLRMMSSSSQPPCLALAASPRGTPSPMPMPTATNATASEVRAPTMIIDSKSRPK